jgi:hypothetical protein
MVHKRTSAVTDTQPRPFDERTALEELERLAERIQATRRQRERAVAEFNAFVKTFKDDDYAARLSALQPAPRSEAAAVAAPMQAPQPTPPRPPVVERRALEAEPAAVSEAPPALDAMPESEPVPASWSAPAPRALDLQSLWRSPRGRIGIAAALLVAVLVASWFLRGGQGESPVAAGPSDAPAAQAQPAPPAAGTASVPTPVASTGAPRAVNVVLTTIRPVWTRVTVDDRKVIEREIPGAQTIPLGADRAIAIRAGDAGAIRLVVDGKDLGAMGRDGQIASRTFSAPSAR